MALKISAKAPIKAIKKAVMAKKTAPVAKATAVKASSKPSAAKKKIAVSPVNASMSDENWKAENDARTLMDAEEIKRDAARLRKAKAVAKKKASEASAVAGI